jgi:hypothetical protein
MTPMLWVSWWISRIIMSFRRKSIREIIDVKDGFRDGFKTYIGCGHRRGEDMIGFYMAWLSFYGITYYFILGFSPMSHMGIKTLSKRSLLERI